jgi:hypothetical protein
MGRRVKLVGKNELQFLWLIKFWVSVFYYNALRGVLRSHQFHSRTLPKKFTGSGSFERKSVYWSSFVKKRHRKERQLTEHSFVKNVYQVNLFRSWTWSHLAEKSNFRSSTFTQSEWDNIISPIKYEVCQKTSSANFRISKITSKHIFKITICWEIFKYLREKILGTTHTHGKSWGKTTSFILSNKSTFLA